MPLLKYFNRIDRMNKLIELRATGNQEEFAKKMNMSVSMLYHYIHTMKELGCPIHYSRIHQTYYYSSPGKLQLSYQTYT